jgi:Tol biopolymer transport system component
MRRTATFLLLVLFGSSAAGVLIRAAQQAGTPPYDIAFTSSRDGQVSIYRMRSDGTQPSLVVPDAAGAILVPSSWSPDGGKIAYFAYSAGDLELLKKYPLPLHLPLYIVNVDGTDRVRLLDIPVEPFLAWSPDSTRLAFSSGFEDSRLGDPRILQGLEAHSSAVYVVDVRTRRLVRLSPFGQDRFVSWSPDGRRIVFSGTEPGSTKYDIYIVDAAGGTPQRIVDAPTVNVQPVWSPRGDQIAFVAAPRGRASSPDSGVIVIRTDGSAPRRISSALAQRASWSPDGRFILIAGPNQIIDTTTGATVELGPGMMDPTFTPDGRSVIYRTLEAGTGNIFGVDVNGTNRRKLTDNPTGASLFTVSPLLRR